MFSGILQESILGRAAQKGLLQADVIDIRTFSTDKHKRADDYPFGGGAGLVMMAQPIVDAAEVVMQNGWQGRKIYLSPRGKVLTHEMTMELAREENLLLLCGHYEGVDQRAIDTIGFEEVSIGDYVLTGGELAAMVLVDSVARHIPGVLGSHESTQEESFAQGMLEYPQYTRPANFRGEEVPQVLLSGHHANLEAWRRKQSLRITLQNRPDLFEKLNLSSQEKQEILQENQQQTTK